MLPAKPPGTNVDIKKSSYKKLSTLLKKYEKKGLLTTKQIHKQDNISAVNRGHDLYSAAAAVDRTSGRAEAAPAANGAEDPGRGINKAKSADVAEPAASSHHIKVTYCYRVPSSLRPIFGDGAGKEDLFTEDQCSEALLGYGRREQLAVEEGGLIKLDKLLIGGLFNKKEPQVEGDLNSFDDTLRRLLGKLHLHHRIQRPSEQGLVEVVKKGTVKKVVLALEDRQGGRKHITRITHVESFAIDPTDLGNLMQRKFQTSSSVTKLPGKQETDKEIALQGNLLLEAQRFLVQEYGLHPTEHIDVKQKGRP
eukprot:jgi/Botrbrau1/18233/Bobra.53_1s0087.1